MKKAVAVGLGVIAVAVILAASTYSGAKPPNVKFIDYKEGSKTISVGGKTFVSFRIENNDLIPANDIRVQTDFASERKLNIFEIDQPTIKIPNLEPNHGTSGERTITITGLSLYGLAGADADFLVTIYVGNVQTDQKEFRVHLSL